MSTPKPSSIKKIAKGLRVIAEVSLVDGYQYIQVDGVLPLTDDTRADRGDTIER